MNERGWAQELGCRELCSSQSGGSYLVGRGRQSGVVCCETDAEHDIMANKALWNTLKKRYLFALST